MNPLALIPSWVWVALLGASVLTNCHSLRERDSARVDLANAQRAAQQLRAEQTEAALESFRKYRNTERNWNQIALDASNRRSAQDVTLQNDLLGARDELDGLRNQLAVYTSIADGGDVRADSVDALRARLAALADVFEQCSRRYIELAAEADRHAADSLMLQAAFPREDQ